MEFNKENIVKAIELIGGKVIKEKDTNGEFANYHNNNFRFEYNKVIFFVKKEKYNSDKAEIRFTIESVPMPESFNGKVPSLIEWRVNNLQKGLQTSIGLSSNKAPEKIAKDIQNKFDYKEIYSVLEGVRNLYVECVETKRNFVAIVEKISKLYKKDPTRYYNNELEAHFYNYDIGFGSFDIKVNNSSRTIEIRMEKEKSDIDQFFALLDYIKRLGDECKEKNGVKQ